MIDLIEYERRKDVIGSMAYWPARAAFLAHLAAEKALKGALIAWGIATRKIHDLVELLSSLISDDAMTVSSEGHRRSRAVEHRRTLPARPR